MAQPNMTTVSPSYEKQSIEAEFLKGLTLTVVTLVTILANALSLVALNTTGKYSSMFFITNLAVTDFLLGLLVMPFTTATSITVRWIFGDFWCQVQACLGFLLCIVSVFTIMLISIERYVMFTYPNKHFKCFRKNPDAVKFFVSATWIYGGVWTFIAWQASEFSYAAPELLNCTVNWRFNRNFTIACGVMTSCLPIGAILCCNAKVLRVLKKWNVSKKRVVAECGLEKFERNAVEARTTRMLVIVVAAFLLCWFPYSLCGLCYLMPKCDWPKEFFQASVFLCLCNSCINPVIYGAFNRRFRRAIGRILWQIFYFRKNINTSQAIQPAATNNNNN